MPKLQKHKPDPKVSTIDPDLVSWHETRDMPVEIDDEELGAKKSEHVRLRADQRKLEDEKKSIDKQYNDDIKALDAKLDALEKDIANKTKMEPCAVIVERHYKHGWERVHRKDLAPDDPSRTTERTLTAEEMANLMLSTQETDVESPEPGKEN